MLASVDEHRPSATDLVTISGICLKSPSTSKHYITVAKHGFPGGVGDLVMHPGRLGACIAEVSGGTSNKKDILESRTSC